MMRWELIQLLNGRQQEFAKNVHVVPVNIKIEMQKNKFDEIWRMKSPWMLAWTNIFNHILKGLEFYLHKGVCVWPLVLGRCQGEQTIRKAYIPTTLILKTLKHDLIGQSFTMTRRGGFVTHVMTRQRLELLIKARLFGTLTVYIVPEVLRLGVAQEVVQCQAVTRHYYT